MLLPNSASARCSDERRATLWKVLMLNFFFVANMYGGASVLSSSGSLVA